MLKLICISYHKDLGHVWLKTKSRGALQTIKLVRKKSKKKLNLTKTPNSVGVFYGRIEVITKK